MIDPSFITRCQAARSHLAAGRLGEAERLYRAVLAQAPRHAPAIQGLGDIALADENYQDAGRMFEIALGVDPSLATARVSLGLVLRKLDRTAEALGAFARAAADAPDYANAHYWLGFTLLEMGERTAATRSLDTAIALQPGLLGPLGLSLYDFLENCDWIAWETLSQFFDAAGEGPRALFSPMNPMMTTDSPEVIATCVRRFAATYYPPQTPLQAAPHPRGGKIKLAYLTADFHDHPVAHLIAGVLEAHDRDAFELTAISYGPKADHDIRRRIKASFDHFLDVGDEDESAIARMIAERKIDIAVSLNGYTTNCRPQILAHRPAPVQVSFQGYPGTMGAPYIDYLIADRHVIGPDETGYYDEKIVWMPHTYQPTDDKAQIAQAAPSRANEGLPEGALVFMGYNRANKISPFIFEVWMRVLARVPQSVLWLQAGPTAQANLRREAATRGIDPARLVFAARTASRPEHIARHRLADLFLDTLPYNAHSTASDALWAGLPVVTCKGKTFPGRVCAGLVTAAGFPELVTDNLIDYENLIVDLATDRPRLAALRARVEAQAPKSPLFQTANFTRHLEAAYRTMYETSQAGLPPESFAVEAH